MLSHARVALLTAACFVLTVAVPLDAAAQGEDKKDQAKQFFEAGKRFYEMQSWRAAIDQFKQAQALLPSPILDYNIALCYEKLGKPKTAVKFYQRYLAGAPKADNRAEVEGRINSLESQVAAPAAPPAPGAPPPAPAPEPQDESVPAAPPPPPPGGYYGYGQAAPPPPPAAPLPPPEQPQRSIATQWWFWALMGVAALVSIGIIVGLTEKSHTYTTYTMRGLSLQPATRAPGHPQARGLLMDRPLLGGPQPAGGLFLRF
ncbi:MAG TPA: hypothetical protein VGQ83_12750 [Polyangia bacterium]|jgi:tetratricopeptide (TPR) repeat protein